MTRNVTTSMTTVGLAGLASASKRRPRDGHGVVRGSYAHELRDSE
jgi:hypothetical protein